MRLPWLFSLAGGAVGHYQHVVESIMLYAVGAAAVFRALYVAAFGGYYEIYAREAHRAAAIQRDLDVALARLRPKLSISPEAEIDQGQKRTRIRVVNETDAPCRYGVELVDIRLSSDESAVNFPAPLPFALRLIPESDARMGFLPAKGTRTVDVVMNWYDFEPNQRNTSTDLHFFGVGNSSVDLDRAGYRLTIRAYSDQEGASAERRFDIVWEKNLPPRIPELRAVDLVLRKE